MLKARPQESGPVRAVRALRSNRQAQIVTVALLGAALGAGLVYVMSQNSRGRKFGPMIRRLRRNVTDYAGSAREAIDDAVETELKDLRRSIRRQRKRFGV
jgi:hypothetical protein